MLHTRTTEVCREHSDWAQARSFTVQKKKTRRENIPTDPKFKQNSKQATIPQSRALEKAAISPRHGISESQSPCSLLARLAAL